jgi:hypothetical protein
MLFQDNFIQDCYIFNMRQYCSQKETNLIVND